MSDTLDESHMWSSFAQWDSLCKDTWWATYGLMPSYHIDGLVQERSNSSALAMELLELRLSCINPSISFLHILWTAQCIKNVCGHFFLSYVPSVCCRQLQAELVAVRRTSIPSLSTMLQCLHVSHRIWWAPWTRIHTHGLRWPWPPS